MDYDCGFTRENKWFRYRAYPMFFRDKLKNIKDGIEHIITYEN